MNKNIQINIPIAWEYVRTVRHQVAAALSDYPEELRSASVVVASELVENAIKYGAAVPAQEWAQFSFQATPACIQMQVSNGLVDEQAVAQVMQMVEQMKPPGACEQLYLARLQELVNDPVQPNRLGLYRIGYEGKFEVDCTYAGQVLTMIARRHVS